MDGELEGEDGSGVVSALKGVFTNVRTATSCLQRHGSKGNSSGTTITQFHNYSHVVKKNNRARAATCCDYTGVDGCRLVRAIACDHFPLHVR